MPTDLQDSQQRYLGSCGLEDYFMTVKCGSTVVFDEYEIPIAIVILAHYGMQIMIGPAEFNATINRS